MTTRTRVGPARKTASTGKPVGRLSVDTELADYMAAFARKVHRSSASQLAPLSAARYAILQTLHENGPMRMGLVANFVGVAARTLTPMADALEHDGFLRRLEDPADRRAQLLKITDSGNSALRQSRTVRTTAVATLFASLRETERITLRNLLRKMLATD